MQNIFPVGQKAVIEQIIGVSRPSAFPPPGQLLSESVTIHSKGPLFESVPKWLKPDKISEIERIFVLETNKRLFSSEEEYMEIRNSIIQMYKTQSGYLPFTSVVTLPFNYRSAARVFDFLEDKKIINFRVDVSGLLADIETGEDEIPASTIKKVNEKYMRRDVLQSSSCNCGQKADYFTSDLIFACETCFELRRYPPTYTSRNFHRITEALLKALWTKEEEYNLLKNIECVGDDWGRVCEGLDKTVDQCIFHFIKMSIIDQCEIFPAIPFTQVPNSISTFVAFVCSMVYPSISSELAKNAIRYLSSPNLMEILLEISKEKSGEVLKMEMSKYQKLERVEIEAKIKRAMLKVDAINEMHAEIQAVKGELEDQRERLIEEAIRDE